MDRPDAPSLTPPPTAAAAGPSTMGAPGPCWVVVMGVCGCGKSSVGGTLAAARALPMIEGDAFHPASNVEKMRQGRPLDDDDRAGWLDALAAELARHPGGAVLACSALRRRYRDRLRRAVPGLRFVFLDLDRDTAAARVAARGRHFMPASLVDSQFATLERPEGEPGVVRVDATAPLPRITDEALQALAGAA